MQPFTTLTAVAAPLPLPNVDTDMIFPAQHGKTIARRGLGPCLFSRERYYPDGSENPDFVLNKPAYRSAQILLAGENFGCGSSREHAPWALLDFGIRCVIAPSFGDIFASNSVTNGLLPARVSEAEAEDLIAALEHRVAEVTVDLEGQTVRAGNHVVPFAIDPVWRTKLLNGWDDLDLTMSYRREIEIFAKRDGERRPWVMPAG